MSRDPRKGQPRNPAWSEAAIAKLIELHASDMTYPVMAVRLNRSVAAIANQVTKLIALGLVTPRPTRVPAGTDRAVRERAKRTRGEKQARPGTLTPHQVERLTVLHNAGLSDVEIMKDMGLASRAMVAGHIFRLRMRGHLLAIRRPGVRSGDYPAPDLPPPSQAAIRLAAFDPVIARALQGRTPEPVVCLRAEPQWFSGSR